MRWNNSINRQNNVHNVLFREKIKRTKYVRYDLMENDRWKYISYFQVIAGY